MRSRSRADAARLRGPTRPPMHRLARLVQRLATPIAGVAPNADGRLKRARVTAQHAHRPPDRRSHDTDHLREVTSHPRSAGSSPLYKPLLRLGREVAYVGVPASHVLSERSVRGRGVQRLSAGLRRHRSRPRPLSPVPPGDHAGCAVTGPACRALPGRGVGVVALRLLRRLSALAGAEPVGASGPTARELPERADARARR